MAARTKCGHKWEYMTIHEVVINMNPHWMDTERKVLDAQFCTRVDLILSLVFLLINDDIIIARGVGVKMSFQTANTVLDLF